MSDDNGCNTTHLWAAMAHLCFIKWWWVSMSLTILNRTAPCAQQWPVMPPAQKCRLRRSGVCVRACMEQEVLTGVIARVSRHKARVLLLFVSLPSDLLSRVSGDSSQLGTTKVPPTLKVSYTCSIGTSAFICNEVFMQTQDESNYPPPWRALLYKTGKAALTSVLHEGLHATVWGYVSDGPPTGPRCAFI
jgi:hypothetical protein